MTWPLSQDFNEAVQNPRTAFADPDLSGGRVDLTPAGLPRPRSGNFADVYPFTGPDGKRWAVKLFTRPVGPTLEQRYAAVAEHLARVNLPFAVGFDYLPQGVKVRGKWFPAVKMPWVDGFPVNQFVRENLAKAGPLEAMLSLWVRLCRRLREAEVTHGDLQHGNVLLVPGGKANALGLKLVDYDGVHVPALAAMPSGESGHASFQHPERAAKGVYSADLDRFPHLVVATALRALLVGGKPLWDRYDTGDNLLFTTRDFADPGSSKLMRELWDGGDPFTLGLLAHTALACKKPMAATPWLDQLMPEGRPPTLTPSQERQAAELLGRESVAVPAELPPAPEAPPVPPPRVNSGGKFLAVAVLGGLMTIGVLTGVVIALSGGKKPTGETAKAKKEPEPETPKEPEKEPNPPTPIIPPPEVKPTPVMPPPEVKPTKPMMPVAVVPAAAPKVVKAVQVVGAGSPTGVRFSADGTKLYVGEAGPDMVPQVHVVDGETLDKSAAFKEFPRARRLPFATAGRGEAIVGGGENNFLVLFRDDDGKGVLKVLSPLASSAAHVSATRGGRYALLQSPGMNNTDPGLVSVVEIDAQAEVYTASTLGVGRQTVAAVFASDGSGVAVSEPGGKITLVGLPGKTPVGTAKVPGAVQAWNTVRNLLVVRPTADITTITTDILIVDPTGKRVEFLSGNYARTPPQLSADGKFLYAATGQAVEVWDTGTWQKAADATIPKTQVTDFDVRPDGKRIAALGADRKLYLIDLPPDRFAVAAPAVPERPATPAKVRKPVPDPATTAKAADAVRENYKEVFAGKSNADRKKQAEKMLDEAKQTTAAVSRYAMLDLARTAASEINDLPLALKAIDALDGEFDVDGPALKIDAVEKVSFVAGTPAVIKLVAEAAAALTDELVEKDEYDKAARAAKVAADQYGKDSKTVALGREFTDRRTQFLALKERFDPVRAALDTLKATPSDAKANALVGKFRCFVRQQWDAGLPLLKKGDDPALKKLAELDLSTGPDSSDADRGAAWLAHAATVPEADRGPYTARGRFWLAKAVASMTGNERAEAAKKLAFTVGTTEYKLGLVAQYTGVGAKPLKKSLIEYTVDVTGPMLRDYGGDVRATWTGVLVPPAAGRYKLIADTKDTVVVRIGAKPDDKRVLESARREAVWPLTEKPVPIVVEYAGKTGQTNRLRLLWVRPGGSEEPIPAECLFHTKADEKLLDK